MDFGRICRGDKLQGLLYFLFNDDDDDAAAGAIATGTSSSLQDRPTEAMPIMTVISNKQMWYVFEYAMPSLH